ncbi:MAG TPA: serine/threonine-protein kinase, partial [Gemmatimonadales bacterium]|nr:serine/threonine-protein kinase [Gemmatimonadales bacterium]
MNEPPRPFRDALAGRYAVESELGAGGMAVVYLAHDVKHDRRVAIKVLRPEIAAGLGAERFVREIRVAAQLQHPHILPLFDSGEAGGLLYYVAPYVEGESLRERLVRERQLAVPDALAIARQVAGALAHAHARGIVHRDIKPENILLQGGEAIVADFGIALALRAAGGERMTAAGLALGTPTYISPEQAAGGAPVDGRSDIYSLGCVVYEMLAGEPPFSSPTPQAVLARHLHDTPPSVIVLRPTVPAPVAGAVARALEKLPADRYRTATDFAAALEAAPAAPAGGRPWWRRRAAVVAALVVVAAAAAGRTFLPGAAFAAGQRALARWDLPRAEAAFRRAALADPQAAPAQLWLAQTAVLAGDPVDAWRAAARSAVANARRLTTARDSTLAQGLLALAEGRFPDGCADYRAALQRDSLDVIAWFGLGECQRRDRSVVRDAASPSGWRFRASYQGAVTAYQRALEIAPALYAAFGAETYNRLSRVVLAERLSWRLGEATPPDTGTFYGFPALDHDTLLLVPYALGGAFPPLPATNGAAVARGGELLHALVAKWVAAFPRSAEAHAALATTLEMEGALESDEGRPTALTENREAQRLGTDPEQRLELALGAVRLRLKLGQFAEAARLADSLLAAPAEPTARQARLLACAALLLGRASRAADLLERTASDTSFGLVTLALPVKRAGLRLLGYVAMGAPADSVRALERRVDSLLRSWVDPGQRATVREALTRQLTPLPALAAAWDTTWVAWPGFFLFDVPLLLARGDTARARAKLAEVRRTQVGMSPSDLPPVPVYPEARLFLALHDTAAAEWLLDRLLDNLASAQTRLIGEPMLAGALPQVMVLRARIALRRHQPDVARRWAAAAGALWRGAD